MSFAEHDESKLRYSEKTVCPHCNYIMLQKVSKLNFKLEGQGWGPSDSNPDAYGITDYEMRQNLDMEKRIEGDAKNMDALDRNIKEL
jgi:hypothetical protein